MRVLIAGSSTIKTVDYDEEKQTLDIEFKGGTAYRYFEVPQDVAQSISTATSAGKYFHNNIKGVFEFERLG